MTVGRWTPGEPVDGLRQLLSAGGVLAIPTESSYGLGATPGNEAGVETIYRIKERDRGKALPVVVADVGQILELTGPGREPEWAEAARHWPGPLSVLVSLGGRPLAAAAGTDCVAVRVPAHPALRELLRGVGPLTATSANRAGEAPILDPDELEALLEGHPARIVDGGVLPGGAPSTLIDLRGPEPRVLRPGPVPWETPPRHPA